MIEQDFENWKMDPAMCSDLTTDTINDPNASRFAYEAWHARDAEIADLNRQLAAQDEALFQELQSVIRTRIRFGPDEKAGAMELLREVFTLCKRGTAALDAYVQEKVDRERLDAMIWCTGAMSLNERDNAVIQKAIYELEKKLGLPGR